MSDAHPQRLAAADGYGSHRNLNPSNWRSYTTPQAAEFLQAPIKTPIPVSIDEFSLLERDLGHWEDVQGGCKETACTLSASPDRSTCWEMHDIAAGLS